MVKGKLAKSRRGQARHRHQRTKPRHRRGQAPALSLRLWKVSGHAKLTQTAPEAYRTRRKESSKIGIREAAVNHRLGVARLVA